jgi:hypothetical protein
MKPYKQIYYGIQDKKLERYLDTKVILIKEKAKLDTDIAVSRNITDLTVIFNEISAEIDKLDAEIIQLQTLLLQSTTEQRIMLLNKLISSAEVDVKRCKTSYDRSKYKWVIFAMATLCSLDAVINHSSFQVLVENLLVSILLSALIAIGLTWASHAIGLKVRNAQTKQLGRLWFIGGLIGSASFFYMLGILRQTYMDGSNSYANIALLWCILCNFFFGVSILIGITYLPTKAQQLEIKVLEEKIKIVLDLESKKQSLIDEEKKVIDKKNELVQTLEGFRTYKNACIVKLEKEKECTYAMCHTEYVLKIGIAPVKIISLSKPT